MSSRVSRSARREKSFWSHSFIWFTTMWLEGREEEGVKDNNVNAIACEVLLVSAIMT